MNQTILDKTTELHVTGTVKWYDSAKGYGFILPDLGGPDVLLHVNVLRAWGVSSVHENSYVEVRAKKTERGCQALEVYAIEPPLTAETDDDVTLSDEELVELLPARVKWFCPNKDYGFANVFGQPEDIHLSGSILRKGGLACLEPGEAISLRTEQGKNGKIASHVLPWGVSVDVP